MEAIGTLAGGIAHDFNNILGIILGNTELVMDEVNEFPTVTENLKEVYHACIRARDVVQQLLSFARKTELAKMPLFMHTVVNDSLKLLRSSIPANISIYTDLEDITETRAIVNSCVWEKSGGDSIFFNTVDEYYASDHISQALGMMELYPAFFSA